MHMWCAFGLFLRCKCGVCVSPLCICGVFLSLPSRVSLLQTHVSCACRVLVTSCIAHVAYVCLCSACVSCVCLTCLVCWTPCVCRVYTCIYPYPYARMLVCVSTHTHAHSLVCFVCCSSTLSKRAPRSSVFLRIHILYFLFFLVCFVHISSTQCKRATRSSVSPRILIFSNSLFWCVSCAFQARCKTTTRSTA